jgi:hypothetical protein
MFTTANSQYSDVHFICINLFFIWKLFREIECPYLTILNFGIYIFFVFSSNSLCKALCIAVISIFCWLYRFMAKMDIIFTTKCPDYFETQQELKLKMICHYVFWQKNVWEDNFDHGKDPIRCTKCLVHMVYHVPTAEINVCRHFFA